jgi:hypothetical protein
VIVAVALLVASATLVAVNIMVCVALMLAGAVYSPPLVTVPMAGDRDQVTEVLLEPETVLVNGWLCPALSDALVGDTVTLTGVSVMLAVALFVVSATLVAVNVIVCVAVMLDGAVYKPPLVTVPTAGETDQVTEVLLDPVTVLVNGWFCPGPSVTLVGDTVTFTVVWLPPL